VPNSRLGPDDWCEAALVAVAKGGLDAIAVEPLARQLGVSKGSFYWHFKNRDALVAATAKRWERIRTEEVIAGVAAISDPRERLRVLFNGAFGRRPDAGRIEAAFVSSRESSAVGPVLRRVPKRRVAFIADAFHELGFNDAEARCRATVAYGAYVGLFVMRHTNPAAVPARTGSVEAFVTDLTNLLTNR